jgi:glycosyltransferase involved in cell wall biosynthesis
MYMEQLKQIAILIPSFMPDERLLVLAEELLREDFYEILIVNDGSGESCEHIFSKLKAMGCRVIAHAINMGKGRALKTGINDILSRNLTIRGVVTADADGQHIVKDIKRVAEALLESDNMIVLGKRVFAGKVPAKSIFGNTITRNVFNFVSGQKVFDTQTGLRGLPYGALPDLLRLSGERYEYEMNMLLEASGLGLKLSEVEIETVYINDNKGSHFNTFKDSWRIYRLIIMFGGSSLISFLIDYALYALFVTLIPQLNSSWLTNVVAATIAARLISSAVNFMINRNVIFAKGKKQNLQRHLVGYFILAACILVVNSLLVNWFVSLGVNEYLAKLPVEAILFLVSFILQKRVVFK